VFQFALCLFLNTDDTDVTRILLIFNNLNIYPCLSVKSVFQFALCLLLNTDDTDVTLILLIF
jgi:hypothetical protein